MTKTARASADANNVFRTKAVECLLSLSLSLMAGCARFEPQPLSPARSAESLEVRSLTNAPLREFLQENLRRSLVNWPAVAWDLDLLTLTAFYYHPSLEVARAQWGVARDAEVTAGQRPNPTLSVTPGYDTTTSIPSPWFPAITLDVPIETAGKRQYRRAHAAQLTEAARCNLATAAWQARSQVRNALLEWTAAMKREEFLKEQLLAEEEVVKLLAQQVQAGAIADAETVSFRIALQKLRVDVAETERAVVEARCRLAESLAVPVAALEQASFSFAWLDSPRGTADLTSTEARRTALQSRADVLSALAEYAAAQSALQLEIARQYPDLRLSPGYQYDQGDNKWSLGLSLDLPVLNQNQGPIAEAKARRAEAAARFNATQAKVLAEVERAVEVLRSTEQRAAALGDLAAAQARQQDSVAAQFKAGAVARVDFLNARLEFMAARLIQLEGQVNLQRARAALEDALQRPLFGSLETISDPGPEVTQPASRGGTTENKDRRAGKE